MVEMKAVMIVLRVLGVAAGAFALLLGFVGLDSGDSVGLAVFFIVLGGVLIFFSLRRSLAVRARQASGRDNGASEQTGMNRRNIIPVIGITLLVVILLSSIVTKYIEANTVEYMMSGREYVPETVTPRPAPTVAPDPLAGISLGRKNAIKKAQSYLSISSFSKKGLIDQLRFEGFTTDEAVYAVDYLEPDWYAEAAEKAASYLSISAFSRQGLIDQLLFEGFTEDEAEYGVTAAGY